MPILDEFKKWLDAKIEQAPPKSLIGKAISYTLNQWHRLIRYVEDGRVGLNNSHALAGTTKHKTLEKIVKWS